jgi:hypothetical protein
VLVSEPRSRLEAVEESVRAETSGCFSDEDEAKPWWMVRARVAQNEDRGTGTRPPPRGSSGGRPVGDHDGGSQGPPAGLDEMDRILPE